ncbi:MAG: CHAT domain-containing protein [Cyanobacteria bacterium CRU_2_1]|nr:CHAT domain-containing protein [Cyanobacteria bacterium CRU_2_1]
MSSRSVFRIFIWLNWRSPPRLYRRILVFTLSTTLGLISVLYIPVLCIPVLSVPALSIESNQPVAETITQSPNAQALLQQGIDRYETEQFAEAIALWQQALTEFVAQGDLLNQALVWNYLSLAYQQLGQWQEAEETIATSLNLLQQPLSPDSQTDSEILAKALNTQGRLHWFRGQLEEALNTWRRATATYGQMGDQTGVTIGLINQASALQALGFSVQAEAELETVYQLLQQQSDPELSAIGLRNLGNALRRVGQLISQDEDSLSSQAVLQESLEVVEAANLTFIRSSTLLELGNTERALRNRAIAIGNAEAAQQHTEAALMYYQQATIAATSPLERLQAQLNQLSLLAETEQAEQRSTAVELASTIQPELTSLPSSRTTIYAQLNFARSLMKLGIAPQTIAQLLSSAVQQARNLNDPIAESYALGQLGELYEMTGQWTEAQDLTQQALLKVEAIQAADIRYRWEWQLGRLLERQGDRAGAIDAYTAAVETLKSIRNDLLQISSDIQFSFRDDVEPVYRGLIQLLLSSEDEPNQDTLKAAIQQVDALQLTEIENFLGCDLAQTIEITEIDIDPTAAKIYPIILDDRLAVILELPNQDLRYHPILTSGEEIQTTLQRLRQDLSEPDRTPGAIIGLQQVYQWLIQPFESDLESQPQIKTLVFVLDGELRNISMAALYDGEQYLISRYAIALAPRLELFKPSPRSSQLKVFLGGVGEPQTVSDRMFPKIEYLSPELEGIQQLVDANPPLLNTDFTKTNLEQQLKTGQFSVIHLKTHGVFSSDPEATFVVAYQDLITGKDLGRLIQTSRVGEAAIELLVLSACSTAQGDDRAVLGLAGTAIQAGAQSAISTLWEAQDFPSTQLMIQFYQALSNSNTTRAEALRQAQLHLLEQGYRTPYIWATYVLVGNWL